MRVVAERRLLSKFFQFYILFGIMDAFSFFTIISHLKVHLLSPLYILTKHVLQITFGTRKAAWFVRLEPTLGSIQGTQPK